MQAAAGCVQKRRSLWLWLKGQSKAGVVENNEWRWRYRAFSWQGQTKREVTFHLTCIHALLLTRINLPRRAKSVEDLEEELAEYLPKVNYDTLSAKMLHDKLAEHSLPTSGSHAAKAKRHMKCVSLFVPPAAV